MHLSQSEIKATPQIKRLNIINSITGIKPGNLIGTVSKSGQTNLAVFSSIVHLGSNPALLGFILRPQGEVRRDTYQNILDTHYYTINHIPINKAENAHYTSAKFEKGVSEFEPCGFTEEYNEAFLAPFVKESKIKVGMKLLETIPIKANNTLMVIGEIEHLFIPDNCLAEEGYVDLEKAESAGISGLNSYYSLQRSESFPYARIEELPNFNK